MANGPDAEHPQGVYVGVLGKTNEIGKLFDWAWGDADWREYVKALYEAHPNDIGIGTEPAICTSGWFER